MPSAGERMRLSYVAADRSVALTADTVGSALRAVATSAPDAPGLVEGHPDPACRRRWTFAQLLEESERIARVLAARFAPGEHVAVWASSTPEWVLLEFAAALAGVVLVTVNPALQPQELEYVLTQSAAVGLFYERSYRGNAMERHLDSVRPRLADLRETIPMDELGALPASTNGAALPDVEPRSPAQLQYTSGTTGLPKGALLPHAGIVNNARLTMELVGMPPGGVYLNCMPLFHTGGCVLGVLGPLQRQSASVCMRQFDPGLFLELCEAEGVTHLLAVPTMLIAAMEHESFGRRDLSSLQVVFSGGAPVPDELVRRIERQLGVEFSILFGQTEAAPVITMTRPGDSAEDKATTLGTVIPHVEVKIVDPATGDTVPTGTSGELCARGFNVMLGYHDMPDKTAETIDADGWLHTGDLATMDDRGYFRIAGRLRDIILLQCIVEK